MIDSRYVPLSIVVGGIVLGTGLANMLRQYDLLRLLILLSLACVAVVLMWQRE